jgi:hypothetical protein
MVGRLPIGTTLLQHFLGSRHVPKLISFSLCRKRSMMVRHITSFSARQLGRVHKSRLVDSGGVMSPLPTKADTRQRIEHVCFVPIADIRLRQPTALSLSAPLPLGSTSHALDLRSISAAVAANSWGRVAIHGLPFLNCFLRVISAHEGQLFAGFLRVSEFGASRFVSITQPLSVI